jgi:AraC family transcriptional regulator
MTEDAHTLGFGVTYDMVAARTACGQLLTLTSHRSDDAIPPHKHTNDYLCIVLAGGFAEQEGNRSHERPSGCVFTHHAGETHHDRFGPNGAMCVNLHFPAGEPGPAIEGRCPPPARVAAQRLALELAARSRDDLAMASLAAEIMGDLRPGEDHARDHGRWLDRIVEAIADDGDGRRWSLRELAAIAQRHPVHVAQAFRAKTGMSLGAFQRSRRLTKLSLTLKRTDVPLAALAVEFGYCDQAHMTAEFSRAFGVSPGGYRRELH